MGKTGSEAIIWGAGKIGRGFLAEIFTDAGYDLTFIEYDKELIKELKEANSYTINKMIEEGNKEKINICDFEVYHSQNESAITEKVVMDNTIIAISVHQAALPAVVKMLVPGITEKAGNNPESKLDIVLCVNMSHPAAYFKQLLQKHLPSDLHHYLEKNIGLIESVVMRISPEPTEELLAEDPLAVLNNGYPEMPVDKNAFKGQVPETDMFRLSDHIEAEEKRKIYTLNMSHVMLAYLGVPGEYKYSAEAIDDSEIRWAVFGALKEAGIGLAGKYVFNKEEMEKWNKDVVQMLENPVLKDELVRLGRDSQRKLSKEDRLVGPALLSIEYGATPFYLAQGIAYGFKFNEADDPGTCEVQNCLDENGIEDAIREVCGLDEGKLFNLIKEIYNDISEGKVILRKEDYSEDYSID